MAQPSESVHGMWSSRFMFILAAAGSAVGLGNIWRFPYLAGESGGGVFVLVYLGCIFLIGIPIMCAEIMLGRAGRQSPINTMETLTSESNASRGWTVIGWMGALAGFMILSFYAVIAGWSMSYIGQTATGTFTGADGEVANAAFAALTGDVWTVVMWHSIFMAITIFIAARGVGEGLETAVKYLMPALFVLLVPLVGYSAFFSGHFGEGLSFLFSPKLENFTFDSMLSAMGQAFFTLSLGMGAIMAYGAYLPREASIVGTATTIAILDTTVALLAGLVVFPLVFANGLEPSAGPGLVFITLTVAFGQMTGGAIFGTIFFVLLTFAAITSAISLVEPATAWIVEKLEVSRRTGAVIVGGLAWFVGLGSAFSLNIWSDVHFLGERTFLDTMDYVSNNIMLPIGGVLIAVFAAWVLDRRFADEQMADDLTWYPAWRFLTRFVAPAAVGFVFVMTFV